MARKKFVWLWSLLLVLAPAIPGYAQLNRGSLEGTVTDPQGAFIPGVKVAVTSMDTNVTLPSVTNSAGYYIVVDLTPGNYMVHFEASGFTPLDLKDVNIPAGNQAIRADAKLQLGATLQTVEVSATATQVQSAPTDYSTTIGSMGIQDIPLSGRDLQQLVFLVPGVVGNGPPGSSFGFNSEFGAFPDPTHMQGSDVSVNGGQGGSNAWYLDGNLNVSGNAESVIVNPSPDAVTEFQTITNGFSAQYGRSGGAVFNVILKSGTNKVHGDVYEYVRNSYFNARNPFTSIGQNGQIIPQDQLRYNNFGGTLAGPVVLPHLYDGKNKTFFFFSWDESILHLNGSSIFTVPTPSMIAGDFSEDPNISHGIWDPTTTVGPAADGTFQRTAFGTPAAGYANGCLNTVVEANPGVTTCNFATTIPVSARSANAMFFINSFPAPNYLNPLSNAPLARGGAYRIASNYLAGLGSSQDGANISLKVDHQWSDKNRYFGEWLFNPGKYNNYRLPWKGATFPTSPWGAYDGFGSNLPFDFANQIIALGNTYTFSPTLINEFRASFSRQYYSTHPATGGGYAPEQSDLPAVIKQLANAGIPYFPPTPAPSWFVTQPGGGSLGWGTIGWTSNMTATESYTILDNVTKLVGKHTLRTGFTYRLSHIAEFQSAPTDLNFDGHGIQDPNQSGIAGGGAGLAQFMLGDVMSTGGGNGGASSFATGAWQPYARHRYWGFYLQDDFRMTPNFTLNLGLRYDIFGAYKTRQTPLTRFCATCANAYTGLPGLEQFWGDPGFPKNSDIVSPNWNDLGPRINFSWSPRGNRDTVIRGGYDIFYSNAYSGINSAQQIENQDDYAFDYFWEHSANPGVCKDFNGACVAWNLDSTGYKGNNTTPVFTTGFPAQQHVQPYLAGDGGAIQKPAHDPMVQSWTLEVQHQLKGNMTLTVGYVGSHGSHLVGLYRTLDYIHTADKLKYRNSLGATVPISQYYSGQTATALSEIYGATSLPRSYLVKPFPAYAGLRETSTFDGDSIYHALDVRLEKRYSHGLNVNLAYTWSKSIVNPYVGQLTTSVIDPIHFARGGDVGGLTGALGGISGGGYQNPDNVNADRALAFNDMPQVLNLLTTYQLPFGAGRSFLNHKGITNVILGGWRVTGTFNAESGIPLSISGPCNGLTCRPDLVGNPSAVPGGQTANDWINPGAFTPPYGSDQTFWAHPSNLDDRWWQFGNAGLRLPGIRSPGFWNLDTSLGKQFNVTESKYFDFRWEMFNALNHQNLGLPNTGFCLGPNSDGTTDSVHKAGCSFGRITNVQTDPRAMEFALKFVF